MSMTKLLSMTESQSKSIRIDWRALLGSAFIAPESYLCPYAEFLTISAI